MSPTDNAPETDLRGYLRVLRRRRGIVAASVLLVTAAALIASYLQTPVYQGTAEVLLQSKQNESLFDSTTGERNDPGRAVQTEIRVLKSKPVRADVEKALGPVPPVSAHAVGETDVIAVKAQSTVARRAASVANAYARSYIDFRRRQSVEDVLLAGKEVQAKVMDLQRQIDALNAQVLSAGSDQRAAVQQSVTQRSQSLLAQQALFTQKLDQLQVDAALKTGGAQLVTPASEPESPVKPKPVRSAVIAVVLGSLLGVGLAFLRDHLDDSIKTKEDVERVATGVATLALIPAVASWKDRKTPVMVSRVEPKSPAAEAYRTLRTSIQFLALDRPMGTIQVTSPNASEGKSTTIANLAVALAQAGQNVVVVCCDLRRPRIHEFFGLTNTVGFTSVLIGDVALADALQDVEGMERIRVLASGPVPPNPSELLSGRRTVEVLTALHADADVVLVDCPPVLPVTDAAVLSSRVDATLLVATAGTTTQKELARAYEVLSQVEAPVIGTVLNGVTAEGSYGYRYGSRYYVQDDAEARRGRQPVAKA